MRSLVFGSLAATCALALALLLASPAFADTPTSVDADADADAATDADPDADGGAGAVVTRNAVLAYPFAFLRRGFAFAYERAFPWLGLAVLGRLAYDRQAAGDFRSNALGLSVEARWYFLRRGPFTRYQGPAAVGPYLGLRLGFMDTRLRTDEQSYVGSSHRLTTELAFGFRMAIASWVDVTPFAAASVNQDYLDGVASPPRTTYGFGLALGLLFDRGERATGR